MDEHEVCKVGDLPRDLPRNVRALKPNGGCGIWQLEPREGEFVWRWHFFPGHGACVSDFLVSSGTRH